MCGRFTQQASWEQYQAPIIIRDGDGLEGVMARWDFVPWFHQGPLEAKKWSGINARIETAATSGAFRDAVKKRRCLVPNHGFFEWKREGKAKVPFWIKPTDADLSFEWPHRPSLYAHRRARRWQDHHGPHRRASARADHRNAGFWRALPSHHREPACGRRRDGREPLIPTSARSSRWCAGTRCGVEIRSWRMTPYRDACSSNPQAMSTSGGKSGTWVMQI
jgi:hypothetical protein